LPRYYPAFIDVKDRTCVVIGGGDFGEEKVVKLLECDASVRVISTHVNESVSEMAEKGIIEWLRRTYQAGDLSDAFIAIAADNPEDVNLQIAEEATERNVPLNVVDVTHLCTFIAPSVARRGEVTVATSTGGASPALARTFREKVESDCPCRMLEYADLAPILSWARGIVRERGWNIVPAYWQNCINEDLLDLVQSGRDAEAQTHLINCLEKGNTNN
jgi:siroheme synthase-like protein|tara:strand:- start:13823 stop:14473 length:651 start_codon:yes stop_codon:yes gene_type:complete